MFGIFGRLSRDTREDDDSSAEMIHRQMTALIQRRRRLEILTHEIVNARNKNFGGKCSQWNEPTKLSTTRLNQLDEGQIKVVRYAETESSNTFRS